MHELKIIQDIFPLIEKVAKDNNLSLINKVILSIGKLRQVQGDFLQFAFANVAKNTIADGAELVINFIPVKILCRNCDKEFVVEDNFYVCPGCGGVSLDVIKGKEIVLESVDGELCK